MKWETSFCIRLSVIGLIFLSTWWWWPYRVPPYNGSMPDFKTYFLAGIGSCFAYIGFCISITMLLVGIWALLTKIIGVGDWDNIGEK